MINREGLTGRLPHAPRIIGQRIAEIEVVLRTGGRHIEKTAFLLLPSRFLQGAGESGIIPSLHQTMNTAIHSSPFAW